MGYFLQKGGAKGCEPPGRSQLKFTPEPPSEIPVGRVGRRRVLSRYPQRRNKIYIPAEFAGRSGFVP